MSRTRPRLAKSLCTGLLACVMQFGALAWAQSDALVPEPQSDAATIAHLMSQGDSKAALARADEVLKEQPRNLQARFMRAVILGDLGRREAASAEYEQLTQQYPELPEPYNNLAVLLAAEGHLTQAEGLLQRAIAAQPDYATAYENLGDLYLAHASDAYQHALRLAPNNPQLQARLAATRELTRRPHAVH
jgi:Flp pilus assembly protein TadD